MQTSHEDDSILHTRSSAQGGTSCFCFRRGKRRRMNSSRRAPVEKGSVAIGSIVGFSPWVVDVGVRLSGVLGSRGEQGSLVVWSPVVGWANKGIRLWRRVKVAAEDCSSGVDPLISRPEGWRGTF